MRRLCRISFCSLVPLWEKSHCKTEKLIRSLPCLLLRFSHSGANTKWRRALQREIWNTYKNSQMEMEPPEPRGKNVKGAQSDPPTKRTGDQREPGDPEGAWRPEATLHYRSKMHDVIGKTAIESPYFHICFNGFTSVLFHLTLEGALNHQGANRLK